MKNPIDELKLYALLQADKVKAHYSDPKYVTEAFDRAGSIHEFICPKCWVKHAQSTGLEPEADVHNDAIYRCRTCGFRVVLAK